MPATYHPRLLEPLLDDYATELPALLLVGPRAAGKSTTLRRRASTSVRLDREREAAAFVADPDAALRGLEEPVLLDEWQNVPGVLGAVRRAVEEDPHPNRFLVTGSVNAELENQVWPGTGRLTRVSMYPMTVREQQGTLEGETFIDRLLHERIPRVPRETPDLRGYVDVALRSGFPDAALNLTGSRRDAWLESYISDLLTHDVQEIDAGRTGSPRRRARDARRLRRYFEAYAISSAGLVTDKSIYDAAEVNRLTGDAYERLLEDLLVTERLPPWSSNRLTRLIKRPKRYVVDAALMTAALRVDTDGVLRDGDILGRLLDTFVTAQLRPELALSRSRPRLHHVRTREGRQEIDLVAELSNQKILAFEVKANAAPTSADARHLSWLRDQQDDDFLVGVVFHTGPRSYELGDRIVAVPISTLWG